MRLWTCARAILAVVGLMIGVAPTSAGATVRRGIADRRAVTNPCGLVTKVEIARVRPGITVGRGRRDGLVCRWRFIDPPSLAGQVAATTTLARGAGSGVFDDALRVDEQLHVPVVPITGLGRRAAYEVTKSNLIVLTRRANIFEVQLLGYNGITEDLIEGQVVALAKVALPRA